MKNILIAMPFDDTHKAYIEKIGTDCEFRYTTIKTATAEEVKAAWTSFLATSVRSL